MIRVLHVIDSYGPGGAETVCLSTVSHLDRARFQSRVILTGRHWLYDALSARGIESEVVRLVRPLDDARLSFAIARRLLAWRPHVVQCHLINAAFYGSLLGRTFRVPAAVTFHGENDLPADDPHRVAKLRVIAWAAARLVFVSGTLRATMTAGSGVPFGRTSVIHNGVDAERFRPAPSAALRQLLGLGDSTLVVGAVGNMRAMKGYDTMLRVMHALGDLNAHLAIIGWERPPVKQQLESLRVELGLERRVHFLGFREDVAELLNGMDIYLNTSVSEGFSLTTVQAMACGIPVVCTRSGGPDEIITDGVDGLLVPVGDVSTIARAVATLCSQGRLRETLVTRARQTVRERFTLNEMVQSYASLYEELAPVRKKAP